MAPLPVYVSGRRVRHVGEERCPPSPVLGPGQSSEAEDLPCGSDRLPFACSSFPRGGAVSGAVAVGHSVPHDVQVFRLPDSSKQSISRCSELWALPGSSVFNPALAKLRVQVLPKKSTDRYNESSLKAA